MNKPAGLHYETCQVDGSREWLMRIGPLQGPAVLFVPALFEEMNRTRALLAGIMRHLAVSGFSCWLPDLPGTGESERALEQCGWEDWRNAVAAAATHITHQGGSLRTIASIRGGCLLDGAVAEMPVWRFAPVEGASIIRDLNRAGLMGGGGSAGYAPSPDLLALVEEARPFPHDRARTVRLASDRGEADRKVDGSALWRRSEPATSAALAKALAEDISQWVDPCAAS